MTDPRQLPLPGFGEARDRWRERYRQATGNDPALRNRSGIAVEALYTPEHWDPARYMQDLGFPADGPMTRGIYASMHRGRPWSQRQLIGLGTPHDYNARLRAILDSGATAVSLIPCNSVYRGYDADQVDPLLLGTCGAVVNTVEDMETCLDGVDLGAISTAMNDPSPFTLLAFVLAVARRRGVPFDRVTGTSNQSDYLSHFVANHMFFRLALPGARRVLVDHVRYCNEHVPRWNPLSVVGQHMQQAGATPAEAMAFTLSSAIQYANDCLEAGLDPRRFLPRFTFFFDISVSVFEEVAKFRAGRRVWARIVRERFRLDDERAVRFKFHAQTSGVDLTRQQPLNNVARVTAQAMAGILGGLQSLHTDAYDEVLSVPTEAAARVAVATQNILREEAGLGDVIDPLGGSYYVEALTNAMQERIEAVIDTIDAAGGMYRAVSDGLVQRMIGDSALAFQERVERGEQVVVGVNKYRREDDAGERAPLTRPDPKAMERQLERLSRFRRERDAGAAASALDALAAAASREGPNVFAAVVDAAAAGATHGEICACLRAELGVGQPLVVA